MSDYTLHNVREHALSNIHNVVDTIEITIESDADSIAEAIHNALDGGNFTSPDIVYIHEAIDIVFGGSFNDFDAETIDFDGVASAKDALFREAGEVVRVAYSQVLCEEITEFSESFTDLIEKAAELGVESGRFEVTKSGSIYGWAAHNYETDDGVCVWSDERVPHAYNPVLLEGELWAVEKTAHGVTVGMAWNPNK